MKPDAIPAARVPSGWPDVERLRWLTDRVQAQHAHLWPTSQNPYTLEHDRMACMDPDHCGCHLYALVEIIRSMLLPAPPGATTAPQGPTTGVAVSAWTVPGQHQAETFVAQPCLVESVRGRCWFPLGHQGPHEFETGTKVAPPGAEEPAPRLKVRQNDQGDWVCQHGTAMDMHCCNCHSGFVFDMAHECPDSMADAAEMLWVVLANVSGGDWTKQSAEWQEAAARWRDNYFAALKAQDPVSPSPAGGEKSKS